MQVLHLIDDTTPCNLCFI